MAKQLTYCQSVERSIITKYRKTLWNPFIAGVKRYRLIEPNDKIAVCISGGKDSMLLAKLMQELHRHSEVPFELAFIVMDPGYTPQNRQKIEENAKALEVPIQVFESDIFSVANATKDSPCYLCARMRRGHLYAFAQSLGCNKIALGHHFNDVIETTLIGMFYGSQLQGMQPMLHSTNFEGMTLIRPLYCVREEDICSWRDYNHLSFLQCACKFTEENSGFNPNELTSKRKEVKLLLQELEKKDNGIMMSIFNSIHAVCLDTFPMYKSKGEEHSFLEAFDREE